MKPAGANYGPSKLIVGRLPTAPARVGTVPGAGGADDSGGGGSGSSNGGRAVGSSTPGYALDGGHDRRHMPAKVMSANPFELILIMYELLFELISDIKGSIAKRSPAEAEPDAERAQAVVEELINSLDFSLEISRDIGAIYFYVRNRIMEANIKFDSVIWDDIESTMRPLYEGFKDAAKQLEAPREDPRKSNRTQIVAGMTYGQNNLKEVVLNTKKGLHV
jgi:flagellar protein FliS